jgi:hypothetical protein
MRWLFWWQPPFQLRQIIVNLHTGDALSGVLWSTRGGWYTLKNASALKKGVDAKPIDGEVSIHRDRILFVQVEP